MSCVNISKLLTVARPLVYRLKIRPKQTNLVMLSGWISSNMCQVFGPQLTQSMCSRKDHYPGHESSSQRSQRKKIKSPSFSSFVKLVLLYFIFPPISHTSLYTLLKFMLEKNIITNLYLKVQCLSYLIKHF